MNSFEVMPSLSDGAPISVHCATQELIHIREGSRFVNEGTRVPENEDCRVMDSLLRPTLSRPRQCGIRQHRAKSELFDINVDAAFLGIYPKGIMRGLERIAFDT